MTLYLQFPQLFLEVIATSDTNCKAISIMISKTGNFLHFSQISLDWDQSDQKQASLGQMRPFSQFPL